MTNANPIPTPETLNRQVARHLAMCMGIHAAAPYIAGGADGGFPRGVGVYDPDLFAAAPAADVFKGRSALWVSAIPDADDLKKRGGKAGFNLGLTAEAVPSPASGINTPCRMMGVRLYVQSPSREMCAEVLSEAARVFSLPGCTPTGGRWWWNPAGMSVDALAAFGGSAHGVIGVPPPAAIIAAGAAGVPVWRVLGVEEYAPIQVLSDEIGAANGNTPHGASGMVACTMTLACMVVPALVAAPSLAFRASLPVGALPGAVNNDAGLRVFRHADGLVKVEGGSFVGDGGAHGYASYSAATVGGIVTAMGAASWAFTASVAEALARPAADLVLMDWRRSRSTTGTDGATVWADVYVHGVVTPGGGG